MFETFLAELTRLKDNPAPLLAPFGFVVCLGFTLLIIVTLRQGALRAREHRLREERERAAEAGLSELKGRLAQLTELTSLRQEELTRMLSGRLDHVTEVAALRQEDFARTLNDRLDRVGQHIGSRLEDTGRRASEDLSKLYARLAAIDAAQKNIAELSGRVVSLQDVLANKQARGAFGQIRMEAIVQDGLPRDAYSFQTVLSNGKRPDCLIHLPNAKGAIAIDAKFPLENFEVLRQASGEPMRREAQSAVRRDISRHIEDIASKYFIPGETQDTAMMFVPSESIYGELLESFPDLIQKAHRARIVIVSPNVLMLAVQTMMTVLKDAAMREQADVIQREVGLILEDTAHLRARILDFQRHFGQLAPGLEKVLAAADKIGRRAARIENIALDRSDETPALVSEPAS